MVDRKIMEKDLVNCGQFSVSNVLTKGVENDILSSVVKGTP